jgi:hypothetical protein
MEVVKIHDLIGKDIYAVIGVGGELLSLVGLLAGGNSLLIRSGGVRLDSLNSLLGALVGIADAASRLSRTIIQLIDLINDWIHLLCNVVLGGAAYRECHCAYDKNWE